MEIDYFVFFVFLGFFYFNNFFYGKGSQITDKYVNNIFSYETGGHFNCVKPINGFILGGNCMNQ